MMRSMTQCEQVVAITEGAAAVGEVSFTAAEPVTHREHVFREMLAENRNGEPGFYGLAAGNIHGIEDSVARLGPQPLDSERETQLLETMELGLQTFIARDLKKGQGEADEATVVKGVSAYGELLYHYASVVEHAAQRHAGSVPYADLYQEGIMVVMRALMRIDLEVYDSSKLDVRSHITQLVQAHLGEIVGQESSFAVHVPEAVPEAVHTAVSRSDTPTEDYPGSDEHIDAMLTSEMLARLMAKHSLLTPHQKVLLSLRYGIYFPQLAGVTANGYTYPEKPEELPLARRGPLVRSVIKTLLSSSGIQQVRSAEQIACNTSRRFLNLYFGMSGPLQFDAEPWAGPKPLSE